jgi:hypothetical protein
MATPLRLRAEATRPRGWLVVLLIWLAVTTTVVGAVMAGAMLALWATHDALEDQINRIQPPTLYEGNYAPEGNRATVNPGEPACTHLNVDRCP